MQKIRKGDDVVILNGKDRGKRGIVLKVLPSRNAVLVEGLNKVKKHFKPNPIKGQIGGILEKEVPIHISNIALFNSNSGKAERVRFQFADGKKNRHYVSGEMVSA